MSHIRLRESTRADQAFFRQMEFETTWASLDPEDLQRLRAADVREALDVTHEILLARPGNRLVIAENDQGERVGLLWFGINRNLVTGEEEAWVYNVSVVSHYRGHGVGQRLMEHAEELARAGGFHTLGLMVASHNTAATRLYERLAFRPTNLVMRKRLVESPPRMDANGREWGSEATTDEHG